VVTSRVDVVREAGVGREPSAAAYARVYGAQFLHLVAVRRQQVAAQIVHVRPHERAPAARDLYRVTGATPSGRMTCRDNLRRLLINHRWRSVADRSVIASFLQQATLFYPSITTDSLIRPWWVILRYQSCSQNQQCQDQDQDQDRQMKHKKYTLLTISNKVS